jgi:hypothetical protein
MSKKCTNWYCRTLVITGILFLTNFSQSVFAQQVYVVLVYAGYLNNLLTKPTPFATPNPFDPSGNIHLTTPTTNPNRPIISVGGESARIGLPQDALHDTGVLLFTNRGKLPVDIWLRGLTVEVERGIFAPPWADVFGSDTFRLQPGASLVLAETENFNFDTSDGGLGKDPVVTVKISTDLSGDQVFTIPDSKRVLLGMEEAVNTAESTRYTLLTPTPLTFPDPKGPNLLNTEITSCDTNGHGFARYTNFGDMAAPFEAGDATFTLNNPNSDTVGAKSKAIVDGKTFDTGSGTVPPGETVEIDFTSVPNPPPAPAIKFDFNLYFDATSYLPQHANC